MTNLSGIEIMDKSFPSRKKERKAVIEEIIFLINKKGYKLSLNDDELYLVIDEALTNAMEHGNLWNPKKVVKVKIIKFPTFIKLLIEDEGIGFDRKNLKRVPSSINNLKPRGRGIYIIKQFCNPKWNKSGNQITLKFKMEDFAVNG